MLYCGNYIKSSDGSYWLTQRSDGNLVIYDGTTVPPSISWNASTTSANATTTFTVLQPTDGNMVTYPFIGARPTDALWFTATSGNVNDTAVMQNDGNFVIYSKEGKAVWWSKKR